LIRELPPSRAYREAELQLLNDTYSEDGDVERSAVQRRLMDCFRRIIPKDPAAREHLEQLLGSEIPLGVLTDLVAYSLHLELSKKQQLLAETDVDRRAEFLVRHLEDLLENRSVYPSLTFPPQFSIN
jgi:ATP-dependent Lon protease